MKAYMMCALVVLGWPVMSPRRSISVLQNKEKTMSTGPLAGIKVIEIAGIGPAPCAGMMLADMGAEVIVVERRSANTNAAANTQEEKNQTFYNRGKRSIALDLKQAQSVSMVLSLVESADILIEGFRPGVMERLGLGPTICHAHNPQLIFGRMTGWGQSGPLAQSAGHDPNYIALSGALWAGGSADRPPTAPLTLVGDMGGGAMILLFGVLSALVHAQKTGDGQVVDAAITDGSAYIATLLRMMHNTGQISDEPGSGWADFGAPWNDTYACADGKHVTICPLEPQFYAQFIERLNLTDDPVFANQWDKSQWPEGKRKVADIFASKSRAEWCSLLEGSDVCFAPVLNHTEAAEHPHNIARGTFISPEGVLQPAPAPRFSKTEPSVGLCPAKGQDGDAIALELGLDPEQLRAQHVL